MGEYVMGHESPELRRLRVQAAWYGPQTRDFLLQAGLAPGMRVLDFGCGTGDVSRIAAAIVGATGAVVGLDRSDKVLAAAERVASHAAPITWRIGDETALGTGERFDAVVGRLVLMHQPDPVACLRALARHVNPNGLVYFEEPDLELGMASWPEGPLFKQMTQWLLAAVRFAGVHPTLGRELPRVFAAAGLPPPEARFAGRLETGDDSDFYFLATEAIRGLLPALERAGVATARDVAIDTLEARLRAEGRALGASYRPALHVGAWCRVAADVRVRG